MREDQRARLAELSEKLADVVLAEADPATWPGNGQDLAEISREDRGNRYWCKKNAAATFALLDRAIGLVEKIKGSGSEAEEDLDVQIRNAEKEATKLLDKMSGGARKVRGKAPI